jgi:hypothetical protein
MNFNFTRSNSVHKFEGGHTKKRKRYKIPEFRTDAYFSFIKKNNTKNIKVENK